MTHRDGFPRFSARSAWRGDAGHRKPCATPSESLGKPPFRSCRRTAGGRREALPMSRIARGFPPTCPLARRIACAISMGHYQGPLVLTKGNRFPPARTGALRPCLPWPRGRALGLRRPLPGPGARGWRLSCRSALHRPTLYQAPNIIPGTEYRVPINSSRPAPGATRAKANGTIAQCFRIVPTCARDQELLNTIHDHRKRNPTFLIPRHHVNTR